MMKLGGNMTEIMTKSQVMLLIRGELDSLKVDEVEWGW